MLSFNIQGEPGRYEAVHVCVEEKRRGAQQVRPAKARQADQHGRQPAKYEVLNVVLRLALPLPGARREVTWVI